MVADRIERDIFIAAPVSRVWAAVTEAEHVGIWFGDAGADIDLRPGGAMVLRWKEHGTYHAVVEEVEPERFFSFRGARQPDEPVRDGHSTLVEFTLTPERDGTRLRVVESGFATLDAPEQEREDFFKGNIEGWEVKLPELRDYAQSPR